MDSSLDFGRPHDLQTGDLQTDVRAALDWWREAGVDCVFDDIAHQWIAPANAQGEHAGPDAVDPNSFPAIKPVPAAAPPRPPRAMIGGDRADWPTAFAGFAAWWLSEPALDGGQVRERVAPRGPGEPALMVLVPTPEAGDTDLLLAGPQGRLLSAMLSAMGLPEQEVYVASVLPRHMPMPDWPELAAQGLGEVLRHHVALARPRRLIAFGRHVAQLIAALPPGPPALDAVALESPLAGNAPPQIGPNFLHFGHDKGSVPLLSARDLGSLLERPIAKGNFWQHWLEWSAR